MILSHKHKFIFFCNGKTGTTSIEKALEPFQQGEEFNLDIKGVYPGKHVPPVILKACLPDNIWHNYFKFTFVRNPWDWFVSSWKYNFYVLLNQLQFPHCLQHPRGALRILKQFNYNYRELDKLYKKKVFSYEDIDFYFYFLQKRFGLPPYSGKYQVHYVFDVNGNRIVNFVGRFEQLQDDFKQIKRKLNLDIELPYLNSTKHDSYQNYYTQKSKQRLAELWKIDIESFGYSFD